MVLNLLQRTLIEKVGYENGFENNFSDDVGVSLSSARHSALVTVSSDSQEKLLLINVKSSITAGLITELCRSFANLRVGIDTFLLPDIPQLAAFLRRASTLAQALPNQAVIQFRKDMDELMGGVPGGIQNTEVERLVKQRIGQDRFRSAMLDYWGNACAVTGISVTEVLRASHAKPWVDCASDEERLDVFNGFLLCANLDSLFDRFLISFGDTGEIIISDRLNPREREELGLHNHLRLRWITKEHIFYLQYHRRKFGNFTC